MKSCSGCKLEKPLREFNFRSKLRGTYSSLCKLCSRERIRNHYYKNKEYYSEKTRKRNNYLRSEGRRYMWAYLNANACVDCGESNPVVLELDHVKAKSSDISRLVRNGSIDELKQEILKCEVRCANCHRRKTASGAGWNKQMRS